MKAIHDIKQVLKKKGSSIHNKKEARSELDKTGYHTPANIATVLTSGADIQYVLSDQCNADCFNRIVTVLLEYIEMGLDHTCNGLSL